MHVSYGLVKTQLICYVGKMWMFTPLDSALYPLWHPQICTSALYPRPVWLAVCCGRSNYRIGPHRGTSDRIRVS